MGLAIKRPACVKAKISAPVAIGRDHLDTGSVASPYRETEKNARRVRCCRRLAHLERPTQHSSGASWVSFHHGGGVGMGYSLTQGRSQ